jgi:hypothetical protein
MITLKEKFWEIIKKSQTDRPTELEQIADDYAIDFADWVSKKGWKIENKLQKNHTLKELLEIFKKERGL